MPNPPSFESLSPIVQVLVLIGGAVAGALAWMFGTKNQNGHAAHANDHSNLITLENEKLRNDLEQVLYRHREAIDNRFTQQNDGIKLMMDRLTETIERQFKIIDQQSERLDQQSERLRQAELQLARFESRLQQR